MKKRLAKALLMTSIAIAVGVVGVYAGDPDSHPDGVNIGGGKQIKFGVNSRIRDCGAMMLDTNITDDFEDKCLGWIDDDLAGFATDKYGDDRAEILLNRDTQNSYDEAWITSSAGAKVKVSGTGDVVITLGE